MYSAFIGITTLPDIFPPKYPFFGALAPENQKVVDLTFDEISKEALRLFALDESGKIFICGFNRDAKGEFKGFEFRQVLDLPPREEKTPLESPRGLTPKGIIGSEAQPGKLYKCTTTGL